NILHMLIAHCNGLELFWSRASDMVSSPYLPALGCFGNSIQSGSFSITVGYGSMYFTITTDSHK
ncbi:uncharacterized protein BJ212DRAFT_1324633, partial [Suillus subaureus]